MAGTVAAHRRAKPHDASAWSYRLRHYHLPLALLSAATLVAWMSLPLFQAVGHQAGAAMARHGQAAQAASHAGSQHAASSSHGSTSAHASGASPGTASDSADTQRSDSSTDHSMDAGGRATRATMARLTTATGYIALALLAITLLIGPANLVLRRRLPVSHYLRRDVGTWTAIWSVVHVAVGLQVHGPDASFSQRLRAYFFTPDGRPLTNDFGLGNWTGLAATAIVVGLLATSSNLALRTLRARPWKWVQRLNYALFALVVAHAIYYGALLRVASPTTIMLGLSVVAVLAGQTIGVWLWRRRLVRPAPQRA